jgi:hypothetical protein
MPVPIGDLVALFGAEAAAALVLVFLCLAALRQSVKDTKSDPGLSPASRLWLIENLRDPLVERISDVERAIHQRGDE